MSGNFGVFNPLRTWKSGDLPVDPFVNIILNEYGKQDDGLISVTANLATDSEIDYAVDRLRDHLEKARGEAKRVLKAQREKILASLDKQPS